MGNLALVSAILAGFSALPSQPQPTTIKSVEKQASPAKKRPTTKEEFAELAKEHPSPPWFPYPGRNRVNDDRVYGTVVEVSADSIEVRPFGKKETVKYPPHVLLATGAVCHWLLDDGCYLLDDVKKGDEVMLGVGTVDKEKGAECFYVSITKRSGDVVPPSRKLSSKPYHLSQQRRLDFEAKGEFTPEELKDYAEKQKLYAEKGLPPPPPLKPPVQPEDTKKKN